MQLFFSHASPYARTARVMLREKQLQQQVREIEVNPLVDPAELIGNNPLGKIPCLINEDGSALFDSTVINEFLNTQGQGDDLFAAHKRDWHIRTVQAASQGLLDVAVQLRIEKTKAEGTQSAVWMQRNLNAILRTVGYLQNELTVIPAGSCFLGLHIACALEYLDFRHAEINWRAAVPQLARWHQERSQHNSLVETRPR